MGDVLLTVCEGERVLHDGHFYDPGESFTLPDGRNAATLIRDGVAEKGKGKATEKGPEVEGESGSSAEGPPPAKEVTAAVPDMTDEALATALEVEEALDPQRKSVLKAIKAEQKKRADAAAKASA